MEVVHIYEEHVATQMYVSVVTLFTKVAMAMSASKSLTLSALDW